MRSEKVGCVFVGRQTFQFKAMVYDSTWITCALWLGAYSLYGMTCWVAGSRHLYSGKMLRTFLGGLDAMGHDAEIRLHEKTEPPSIHPFIHPIILGNCSLIIDVMKLSVDGRGGIRALGRGLEMSFGMFTVRFLDLCFSNCVLLRSFQAILESILGHHFVVIPDILQA